MKKIIDDVETKINRAYELAEKGDIKNAVELFGELRSFGEHDDVKEKVDDLEASFKKTVIDERDHFRSYVNQGNPPDPERKIIVIADSLGLPRPGENLNTVDNFATSYSYALREAVKRRVRNDGGPKTSVIPICQRYATSNEAIQNLENIDVKGADVVVHVGLNDFSRRIFMERQRLSLKLLPNDLTNKIVKFSQVNMYRADLIRHFSDFCYVPPDQWKKNILKLASNAKDNGARSVTWLSIVQLPSAIESHTPDYRYNVLNYNLALYKARKNGIIDLLDVDRFFWENGFKEHMNGDLMHLSHKGHLYVCNRLIEKIFDLSEYKVKE